MIHIHLLIIAIVIALAECGTSYKRVQFFTSEKPVARKPARSLRQLDFPEFSDIPFDLWGEDLFPIEHTIPEPKIPSFPSYTIDHGPPIYSGSGQGFVDPFLLTGRAAKRAARILYSQELFFNDIPHERAMMYNQQMRRRNGLSGHRLGSLRPQSPFYRKS